MRQDRYVSCSAIYSRLYGSEVAHDYRNTHVFTVLWNNSQNVKNVQGKKSFLRNPLYAFELVIDNSFEICLKLKQVQQISSDWNELKCKTAC